MTIILQNVRFLHCTFVTLTIKFTKSKLYKCQNILVFQKVSDSFILQLCRLHESKHLENRTNLNFIGNIILKFTKKLINDLGVTFFVNLAALVAVPFVFLQNYHKNCFSIDDFLEEEKKNKHRLKKGEKTLLLYCLVSFNFSV